MVLGGQLRRLREDRNISREEAGEAIRGSESKISRLELGRVSLKERDVSDLLSLYGVTDGDERDAFLELVRESNQPGWWHRYHDLLPRWFQDYVGLDEAGSMDVVRFGDAVRAAAGRGAASLEVNCHPGVAGEAALDRFHWGYSWGAEAAMLVDPGTRVVVSSHGYRLGGFADLPSPPVARR